jgi:hypothetical protein
MRCAGSCGADTSSAPATPASAAQKTPPKGASAATLTEPEETVSPLIGAAAAAAAVSELHVTQELALI